MSTPRVYADFNNADREGRIRLNCYGTSEDLTQQGVKLTYGTVLLLYDDDLEVEGIAEYSHTEQVWVAVIDWEELTPAPIE